MKRLILLTLLFAVISSAIYAADDYYYYIDKAKNGNKIAQYNIGYFYYYGEGGVSRDYEKAVSWYRKAANQGLAEAQAALGQVYSEGHGVTKDYSMAAYWYSKAVEQGNAVAQNNLGVLYSKGQGVPKDKYKAAELYLKAADKGDEVAQYNIAGCYADGKGVAKSEYNAFRYYQKSAEQGYASAQYKLGRCYDFGEGVTEDNYQAVKWYQKAAEKGVMRAQNSLGLAYYEGTGIAKDYDRSVHWLRKARAELEILKAADEEKKKNKDANANKDDDEDEDDDTDNTYDRIVDYLNYRYLYAASYELGMCYYNGTQGKTRSYSTAAAWFRDAAKHDNRDAMYMLGKCYALGNGVTKNQTTAVEWYKKAADQLQEDALYELGLCYKNGTGVKQSDSLALNCFEGAAERNHVEAMYEAGRAYEKQGLDVYAADWYLLMVEKGNAAQQSKAEKRLQVLSDNYEYDVLGWFTSKKAYDYIHQGSLTLKAANPEEKIYTKQSSFQDYTYRQSGEWSAKKIPVGKYYVKRVRDKWEDRYDTIVITHPSTSVTLPPMTPKTGTLIVESRPKKANVYIDGVNRGTTPWKGELQIGEHSVRVGGKKGRIDAPTQYINVPYQNSTQANFKLKSEWYYGSDDHPDHYLEPMCGIEFAGYNRHHYAGLRYGWIPKRFGLDVTALYGITNQELSATIGPTFRLTNFSCPLSLQLALGGGAMYRFSDKHITWVADAALRFGFREGYKDHKFAWWSFSLGTRYYDGRFIPTASISLMPIRAFTLAAIELEDFPRIYTEIQAGYEFRSGQWMMGAQLDYIPGHLGVGAGFMVGFDGGWDVTAGPVFRLTPDYVALDLQVYQGFGYGDFNRSGFIAETGLRFAFGHDLPYWGLWSFNVGCLYGDGNVAVTFGCSLPIISIIGTAGMATFWYL